MSSDRTIIGNGSFAIYMSRYSNGTYTEPVILDGAINTSVTEQIGFIAPDESCLVFCRYPPKSQKKTGLYISFRRQDGSWTEGKNMGPLFNDPPESCTQAASLSPDGKYQFFSRRFDEAIYWVDARILEQLR